MPTGVGARRCRAGGRGRPPGCRACRSPSGRARRGRDGQAGPGPPAGRSVAGRRSAGGCARSPGSNRTRGGPPASPGRSCGNEGPAASPRADWTSEPVIARNRPASLRGPIVRPSASPLLVSGPSTRTHERYGVARYDMARVRAPEDSSAPSAGSPLSSYPGPSGTGGPPETLMSSPPNSERGPGLHGDADPPDPSDYRPDCGPRGLGRPIVRPASTPPAFPRTGRARASRSSCAARRGSGGSGLRTAGPPRCCPIGCATRPPRTRTGRRGPPSRGTTTPGRSTTDRTDRERRRGRHRGPPGHPPVRRFLLRPRFRLGPGPVVRPARLRERLRRLGRDLLDDLPVRPELLLQRGRLQPHGRRPRTASTCRSPRGPSGSGRLDAGGPILWSYSTSTGGSSFVLSQDFQCGGGSSLDYTDYEEVDQSAAPEPPCTPSRSRTTATRAPVATWTDLSAGSLPPTIAIAIDSDATHESRTSRSPSPFPRRSTPSMACRRGRSRRTSALRRSTAPPPSPSQWPGTIPSSTVSLSEGSGSSPFVFQVDLNLSNSTALGSYLLELQATAPRSSARVALVVDVVGPLQPCCRPSPPARST